MITKKPFKPTAEQDQMLRNTASKNYQEAIAARLQLAEAMTLPLRQGVLPGDITSGIFQEIVLGPGSSSTPEFPLDWLAPGTENEFVAYAAPKAGYVPQRMISGDYVVIPTFRIVNAIDWDLSYAEDARWDIVGRASQVLRAGFTKKRNDDAMHVLIAAGKDRNLVIHNSDATAGFFTKRLVSLAQLIMRRNGGGNSTSINRGKLTDILLSPEALEDIRNWNVDQIDEVTRREIFLMNDTLTRVFGVNLHDVDELGEGQEYQTYYETTLGGSMGTREEIAIGLDLSTNDSFFNPVKKELTIQYDDTQRRSFRAGYFGESQEGFGCLDSRRVLLLAI